MPADSVARIFALSALEAGQIDQKINVAEKIGGIEAGTVYPEGTSLSKIIEDLLSGSSPASEGNVYYGVFNSIPSDVSNMTFISSYKEVLLEDGYVWDNISANNEYICFAIDKSFGISCCNVEQRGFSLEYDTIELDNQYLYVLPDRVIDNNMKLTYSFKEGGSPVGDDKAYIKVSSDIPDDVSDMDEISVSKESLISDGYIWNNIRSDNEYICFAIGKSLGVVCYKIEQQGFSLEYNTIDLGSQYLYVLPDRVTDDNMKLVYYFKEV